MMSIAPEMDLSIPPLHILYITCAQTVNNPPRRRKFSKDVPQKRKTALYKGVFLVPFE